MFLIPPVNFRYKNALMANRVTPGEVWVGKNRLMCTERWQVARTEGPKPKTQMCRGMKLKKRKYQNLKSKNKRFHLLHPSIFFFSISLPISSSSLCNDPQFPAIDTHFPQKKFPTSLIFLVRHSLFYVFFEFRSSSSSILLGTVELCWSQEIQTN